jgi:hypothetical protein
MKFFDHLFRVTQRTHALMSHWSVLCEDDGETGDRFHQAGRFHAASLHDFLHFLCAERVEMNTHLDALEHAVERAIALMEATGSPMRPHTYGMLCTLLKNFDPYLDKYPELSPEEAYQRFLDNTLDHHWPLDAER